MPRRWRAFGWLLLAWMSAFIFVSVPAATVSAATQDLCSVADQLLADGHLSQAATVYDVAIKDSGESGCAAEGMVRLASQRAEAAKEVDIGDGLVADGKPVQAYQHYLKAHQLDDANTAATQGMSVTVSTRTVQRSADRWDRFYADYAAPAARLVLPFLAILLFLIVLSRLASRFLVPVDADEYQPAKRCLILVAGVALTAGAAALATLVAPLGSNAEYGWLSQRWWLDLPKAWWLALAGGLVGVVLWGLVTGRALRLQVQARHADGTTDSVATAYVVARLDAIGSTAPRGLEVPGQTDVDDLPEDALSTLPQGRVAAALISLLRALLPREPWRADIGLADDERVTITLSRNGRQAASAVVSAPILGLDGWPAAEGAGADSAKEPLPSEAQVLSAVAAFLLVQLSERHPRLRPGLCGAHDWRSVALQVLADMRRNEPTVYRQLLAQSLSFDPGNATARVAYLHAIGGRRTDDIGDQRRFAELIASEYTRTFPNDKVPDGFQTLQLRELYSMAAAWLNVRLLDSKDDLAAQRARDAVSKLVTALNEPRTGNVADFVIAMRPSAAYLWKGVVAADFHHAPKTSAPVEEWTESRELNGDGLYDRACYRAENGDYNKAMDDLELVRNLGQFRLAARNDPSFVNLRDTGLESQRLRFKELVADPPPARFIDLAPIASAAVALEAAGVTTANQVLDATTHAAARHELARSTSSSVLAVTYWRRLAQLNECHDDLRDLAMLDLVFATAVTSVDELRSRLQDISAYEADLKPPSHSRRVNPPDRNQLDDWRRSLTGVD